MPKPESKQKVYKITLSKVFTYPSCVINEKNPLEDLHQKAVQDFLEKASSGNYNTSDFDIKLEAELPFSIRNKKTKDEQDTAVGSYTAGFIIKELAAYDFEQKYGAMDMESNPDIFEFIDEQRDVNGDVVAEEDYYLKEEAEEYLNDRVRHYSDIINATRV
jgi:hypothetical protein